MHRFFQKVVKKYNEKDAVEFFKKATSLLVKESGKFDEKNPKTSAYNLIGKDDHAEFEITNWTDALGSTSGEPIPFWGNKEYTLKLTVLGQKVGSEAHVQ